MSDVSVRLTAALADRYRIERDGHGGPSLLGAGGMATVYLAEDLKHHRRVAIKVLRPELAMALGAERFLREIATTANLRHPHILPLYDSGEAAGFLYYVMPLVEGESLRARLDRQKQLPIEEALTIAREVADALGYAHQRGIIHRDIKPENILLEGGHAVVADFGIARAVSSAGADKLTSTGISVGTPLYMSPEQAAGDPNLDGRSDLYSLGCVLYEMLGGQAPFTGPTAESITRQHIVTDAPPITNLRPTVPAAVAGALARSLAKNPADRFNPVGQFAEALRADAGALTVPRPSSAGMRAPPSKRVSPLAIGAIVGVALITIAAITLFARRSGDAPDTTIGRTSQVTRDPGLEVDPALSPDGTSLAYAAGPTNGMQIYVRQVSGGRVVQLTSEATGNFRSPRWSPDGSRIAYQSGDGIFVVPALGGASRRITRIDPRSVQVVGSFVLSGLDWSPDGKRIAWAAGFIQDRLTVTDLATGDSTIVPLPPGGGFSPAWSPDGRTVALAIGNPIFVFGTAYFANVGTSSIWLVPIDGSRPTQVTSDSALNVSPQWSPDGRTLFWVSDRGGSRDIYQWRIGSHGEAQRLTTGSDAHGMSVSRTTGRLAYSRLSSRSSIWSIPGSSRGPLSIRQATQITTGNETIEDLDLSPDGKWLVFDSDRGGNSDVYVMPAAGGEARALTSDPAGDFSADWSPDGRSIAFHSLRDGNRNVYLVGADGTGLRRLTSGSEEDLDPDWAADGTTLLFQSFTSTTSVLHAVRTTAGASPEVLLNVTGDFAHWAPQGRDFFYHSLDGLHLHRADRSADTLLVSNAAEGGEATYGAYAPDGKEIYYLVRSASQWRIRSVSLAGGPHRELVDFDDPARQHAYYGFCTNGRLFYFTIGSLESDIWVADLEQR